VVGIDGALDGVLPCQALVAGEHAVHLAVMPVQDLQHAGWKLPI
jgi:hypothetical protein